MVQGGSLLQFLGGRVILRDGAGSGVVERCSMNLGSDPGAAGYAEPGQRVGPVGDLVSLLGKNL